MPWPAAWPADRIQSVLRLAALLGWGKSEKLAINLGFAGLDPTRASRVPGGNSSLAPNWGLDKVYYID